MPGPPPCHRPARIAGALVVSSLVLSAAACGASQPTSRQAAAAETATAVCELLRAWNNEMAASLNATSDAITADDDPDTAPRVLGDGYDELIAIAEAHVAELDELDLPFSDVRDPLLDDLRAGAEASVDELEDQRASIDELDVVEVDDQPGVLGGAFTSLEKAQSVLEPRIAAYDDEEVTAAFAAEPSCRHVIQPA